MISVPKSQFEMAKVTDTMVVLIDLDVGCSITNDAVAVIEWVDHALNGLGKRRVYYRDTTGRFDELVVVNGKFDSYKPCSVGQQKSLGELTGFNGCAE